jgi:hypothetical protein
MPASCGGVEEEVALGLALRNVVLDLSSSSLSSLSSAST